VTTSDPADLIDRLAAHTTLGAAPREELAWLAAHGTVRELPVGAVLTPKGAPVEGMFAILSGRIALFIDRGAGLQKMTEWREGEMTGLLPFSRLVTPPADTTAQEPTTIFAVPREHLRAMTRECPELTAILVHAMLDRARAFTSSSLHDEKLMSLGRLSAGLAHELNNPAAAIERGASLLGDRIHEAQQAAEALGAARLTPAQLAAVDGFRHACAMTRERGVRSPLEEARREEALADWLADRRLDTQLAESLGETALTAAHLDDLAAEIGPDVLAAALRAVATGCAARSVAEDILDAATRITGLVAAIKGFSRMDQAQAAEAVDLRDGLITTVAVLKAKARSKSVAVVVEIDDDVPRVQGFAGELNQIWANLIENALDAAPEAGRVEVRAARDGRRVAVRVVDNGAGIPPDVRERIFDPFFTTKPMGQGTGLGLDIVRRLVRHNDAEVAVESAPGRTEFKVLLPIADVLPAGTANT
jgi:signal transduction histidine kinase